MEFVRNYISTARLLKTHCLFVALIILSGQACAESPRSPSDDLAKNGTALAKKYCFRCHGGEKSKGNKEFNILDQQSLLKSDEQYVIVGDTENSAVWQRIADDEMPPEGLPQMTAQEKTSFRSWLLSGAPIDDATKSFVEGDSATAADASSKSPAKSVADQAFPEIKVGDIASAGKALLKKRCGECHPGNGPADFDPNDHDRMVTSKKKIIVPGDPDSSRIFDAVFDDRMPYDDNGDPAPLSTVEKDLLRKWIESGAQYPDIVSRDYVNVDYVWDAAFRDLRTIPEVDRRNVRYFSLLNVYNNSQRYSDDVLDAHRAALSKVVNSLSNEASIVPPHKVDDKGILWRINMDDYGWNDMRFDGCGVSYNAWGLMMHQYPYGIRYSDSDELTFRSNYEYVVETTGTSLPVMRADWFTVNATQDELYYLINRIPKNSFFLERALGIDIPGDFNRGRLIRAALLDSGVSHTNRLMDRHSSGRTGYYWKSYDFDKSKKAKRDLTVFPLGPKMYHGSHVSNNIQMQEAAFEEDGGEVIYQLPNGMQAYMLVDNLGNRLNAGPNEVVRDKFETAGTAEVRNALSCMRCHAGGMKDFTDDIAENIVVGGNIKRHAESLFRPKDMEKKMNQDANSFKRACLQCYEGVLDAVPKSYFEPSTEPVGIVATKYLRSLTPFDGAIEMGLKPTDGNVDMLTGIIVGGVTGNRDLQRRGLKQWTNPKGRVNRDVFDDNANVISLHQRACQAFNTGRPQVFSTSESQRIFEAFEKGTELNYRP